MGFPPPSNNLDPDGEADLLKLQEDIKELVEEQIDVSDDKFAKGEFHLDLWRQAEDGLKEIRTQFQIDEIIGIFQDYSPASSFDLRVKSIPGKNRYAWEF
jgi:hypothetical protein